MPAIWYVIVAAMLAAWAVLDGFDFGAGIVHLFVARTDRERATVLATIGPVWDGNEVWLVAAGGVLVFAFPRAYAAALSGLYLAFALVIWLLIGRGIAIEVRNQVNNPLWRSAWDSIFAAASTAMAFVGGVAVGNLVRGVPIDESGWFHLDLFEFETTGGGAINGYTALVGVLAVAVLAAHGATYLAWKTTGMVHDRSVSAARRAWVVVFVLGGVATVTTAMVRPSMFITLSHRPWAWPFAIIGPMCAPLARPALARGLHLRAFLLSSALIASLLLATAASLFPILLASTLDPRFNLNAYTAASGPTGLAIGLAWWVPALALAVAYFVNLFWSIRGKIEPGEHGH